MSINAIVSVKLRVCEEHDNTIVVFAGDFCPLCAALEDLKEAKEDLDELFAKSEEEDKSCTSSSSHAAPVDTIKEK